MERLKKELERHLVDAAATTAINEADGNVKLLIPHVKARVKLTEVDGQYRPSVVGEDGSPRVNGEGNPLSIKDLVSEMRSDEVYAGAFKGTGQSGSGSEPTQGGEGSSGSNGAGTGPIIADGLTRAQMTGRQKVDFIREHGDEKYQSLPYGVKKAPGL